MDTVLEVQADTPNGYGSNVNNDSNKAINGEFHYAIIFPNTPHAIEDVVDERISYQEAVEQIRNSTAGSDKNKQRAIDEFRIAWMAKFRAVGPIDSDTIPLMYFRQLVRDIVIQRLESIPGVILTTQISDNNEDIICLLRINRELMFSTARAEHFQVPIWSEIDPGQGYWFEEDHLTHESYQWTHENGEKELYRMFLNGEIQPEDAQVFPNESKAMLSRRIHALKRLCDPEISYYYPSSIVLFAPFQSDPCFQYLFQHIEGTQFNMPFRVIDKIRLTKIVIDYEFDCDMLQKHSFIKHHMCLHTFGTTEDNVSLDVLASEWGKLTAPLYVVTNNLAPIYAIFYYQPLQSIRDYYGEQIALYFAYNAFYAEKLLYLVILAFFHLFLSQVLNTAERIIYHYILVFVICLYSKWFLKKWCVQQEILACKWGMTETHRYAKIRAEYKGVLKISPISSALELHSPPYIQMVNHVQSKILLFAVIALNSYLIYEVFAIQYDLEQIYTSTSFVSYTCIIIALIINLSNIPFHKFVVFLNEWENHRTQVSYEKSLTVKFTIFQTINSYGPIIFSIFFKPYIFGCGQTFRPHLNAQACREENSNLLLTVVTFNLLLSLVEIISPLYSSLVALYKSCRTDRGTRNGSTSHQYQGANYSTAANTSNEGNASSAFEAQSQANATLLRKPTTTTTSTSMHLSEELELSPYDGVLFDYAQIVVNFGYMSWFASLCPIVICISFCISIVQLRVDAYKLCFQCQRPFPQTAKTIGGWLVYLNFLTFASVVINAANVVFLKTLISQSKLSTIPISNWLYHLFLFTITITILYVLFVMINLHDCYDYKLLKFVKSTIKRQRYVQNKYLYELHNTTTTGSSSSTSSEKGIIKGKDCTSTSSGGGGASVDTGVNPAGSIYLNGIYRYIINGSIEDWDHVDELREEIQTIQTKLRQLEIEINEIRSQQADDQLGSVQVLLIGINILPIMDRTTKACDPFVKLKMKYMDKIIGTQAKTTVKKKQRSPMWNETFEFKVKFLESNLMIEIYDWNLIGKSVKMGDVGLPITCILPTNAQNFNDNDLLQYEMATMDVPIQIADKLVNGLKTDIVKFGKPSIALKIGIKLNKCGCLVLRQYNFRSRIKDIKEEMQKFLIWNS